MCACVVNPLEGVMSAFHPGGLEFFQSTLNRVKAGESFF
ncbi:hypothetical protein THTE_3447 [Thermogutta terrifontis]|uniref:Uncharacterized protein n=1 Tax=Thermogutta terrifontis TaxID=1331910 RepID=A0A286RJB2_9BACT|nr:hypothetical protein THTE_3447 [Thermogutta terrifontis]